MIQHVVFQRGGDEHGASIGRLPATCRRAPGRELSTRWPQRPRLERRTCARLGTAFASWRAWRVASLRALRRVGACVGIRARLNEVSITFTTLSPSSASWRQPRREILVPLLHQSSIDLTTASPCYAALGTPSSIILCRDFGRGSSTSNNSRISGLFEVLRLYNVLQNPSTSTRDRKRRCRRRRPRTASSQSARQATASRPRRLCSRSSRQRVRRRSRVGVLVACAAALALPPACDDAARTALRTREAAEGDVVVFALPDTVDGTHARMRRTGRQQPMRTRRWVHPLVEQGADQGDDEVMLVEDGGLRGADPVPGRHRIDHRRRLLRPAAGGRARRPRSSSVVTASRRSSSVALGSS